MFKSLEAQRKYRLSHLEQAKKSQERWRKKRFGGIKGFRDFYEFGGNQLLALKRDNYRCVVCGMTNNQHRERWKRDLTVDHIDGKGRYSKVKNNSLDNLQTLCLLCHGRKDGLRNGLSKQ